MHLMKIGYFGRKAGFSLLKFAVLDVETLHSAAALLAQNCVVALQNLPVFH